LSRRWFNAGVTQHPFDICYVEQNGPTNLGEWNFATQDSLTPPSNAHSASLRRLSDPQPLLVTHR